MLMNTPINMNDKDRLGFIFTVGHNWIHFIDEGRHIIRVQVIGRHFTEEHVAMICELEHLEDLQAPAVAITDDGVKPVIKLADHLQKPDLRGCSIQTVSSRRSATAAMNMSQWPINRQP